MLHWASWGHSLGIRCQSHLLGCIHPFPLLAPSRQCPERKPCPGQWVPSNQGPCWGWDSFPKEPVAWTLPTLSLPPLLCSTSVLDHQPSSSLLDSWGAQGCRTGAGRGLPTCSLADSPLLQAAFLCPQEAASQGLLTREPLRVSGKPPC